MSSETTGLALVKYELRRVAQTRRTFVNWPTLLRRIAERALYAAARNTHSAATTMRKDYEAATKKDPEAKKEYLAMYGKAVDLYRQFIATYAESALRPRSGLATAMTG